MPPSVVLIFILFLFVVSAIGIFRFTRSTLMVSLANTLYIASGISLVLLVLVLIRLILPVLVLSPASFPPPIPAPAF